MGRDRFDLVGLASCWESMWVGSIPYIWDPTDAEWDGPSKLSGSPQPTSTPVVVPSLGAAGLGVGGWRRVGGGEI